MRAAVLSVCAVLCVFGTLLRDSVSKGKVMCLDYPWFLADTIFCLDVRLENPVFLLGSICCLAAMCACFVLALRTVAKARLA